jgi:GNAT superfamily N-acetyltransferase
VVEIRRARDADVDGIGFVHATSRRAAYAGLVPPAALDRITPDTQAAYWRMRLTTESDPHAVHVVVADDDVVGFALGSAEGGAATLHAIHVLPHLHGTGAGQALHDRVLEDFAAWGCRTASLWVVEGNERAQSFYRRNGWSADGGRTAHRLGGVDVPALRYRRTVP